MEAVTETLDKLYLEYSQITQARNKREIDMATLIVRMSRSLRPEASELMFQARDFLNRQGVITQNILRGCDERT